MKSIRRRLLVSILSVIALVTLLLAVATYFSIRDEMDELYDENMAQVAVVLARTGLQDENISMAQASARETLKGEEEFLIQIWRGKNLAYTSHPAIRFTLQGLDGNGFGHTIFQGGKWHYYYLRHDRDVIQIAQDLEKRHAVITEIYRVLVVPILIQLPLLAGLIWVLVGYGFRPLTRVSNLIRKRTAAFLEPLPEDSVPAEIKVLVDALNDLLIRLKSALETQRRFTADAAHELRTPLTAIRLQLDILHRATSAGEKQEALETLEKGVARSIRLVQQLLELARQEPENVDTPFSVVNLGHVIEAAMQQAIPFGRSKNIELTVDIEDNLTLRGNAPHLSVMIENLVNNAILYTPEHGHARVEASRNGTHIVIEVKDDGIGIAPKDRERIFDRFYRVAGTGMTGSGLGLSIVRTIADLHGIEIEVREGLGGKGTNFRLVIPGSL